MNTKERFKQSLRYLLGFNVSLSEKKESSGIAECMSKSQTLVASDVFLKANAVSQVLKCICKRATRKRYKAKQERKISTIIHTHQCHLLRN